MVALPAMMNWMQSLSDLTRSRLLRLLERTELTVVELCAVLQAPQSTISRHLKVLADDGWVTSRREATRRLYRMTLDDLDPAQRRLWLLVREQTSAHATAAQDDQRLERVLSERQTRGQAFFSSAAGQWDKLRAELFGRRLDEWVLAALVEETAVVGDLGCGTGSVSELLSPFVRRIVAVDESAAMLQAASSRLQNTRNVDLRSGQLTQLPIAEASLDAALLVLVLPYISEPALVIAEAARVLKPGGKLVLVDIQRHDRREYQQEMGHLWLGFEKPQITGWVGKAGFQKPRYVEIPPDAQAKGPALFAVTARRKSSKSAG